MEARVKATGEIIDIIRNSAFDKDVFYASNGQKYNREELSFDFKEKSFPKDTPDYWTRLEHTYAGMAMQSLILMGAMKEDAVITASDIAQSLVEKMKEERK